MFLSIGTARNLIIFSCPNTYVYYGSQTLMARTHRDHQKKLDQSVVQAIEDQLGKIHLCMIFYHSYGNFDDFLYIYRL